MKENVKKCGDEWKSLLFRIYICVVIFIIAFKFCSYISVEQGNFPLSSMEWLISNCWPEFLVPMLGGLSLLFAVCLYPLPLKNRGVLLPGAALLVVLSGLPGLIHTTEWHYTLCWFAHFSGNFCFVTAIWYVASQDKKLFPAILNTLAVSCIISCLQGWRQHFGGLRENLQMMIDNAKETGRPLSQKMIETLRLTRVYGSFVDPNIYAAHILLLGPIMIKKMTDWSRRFTPKRVSFFLFLGVGLVLYFGAIFWSGSRGGLLGMTVGIVVLFYLLKIRLRWRILGFVSMFVIGGIALCVITYHSNRDFSTASIRVEYYTAAVKMFLHHPISGVGLGEFFPWHMRLKPIGFEEARDAHSLFFAALSQTGILGGVVAIIRILIPFLLALGLWKRYRTKDYGLFAASCIAWGSWNFHSLVQFNDMIPATYSFVFIVGLAGVHLTRKCEDLRAPAPSYPSFLRWLLLAFALLVMFPVLNYSGERKLQIGENAYKKGLPFAEGNLYAAAKSLKTSSVPWRLLGDLNIARHQFAKSVQCNQELVKRTPHRASSYCRLAKVLLLNGQYDEMTPVLEKAEKWYPGSSELYIMRAMQQIAPEIRKNAMPEFRQRELLLELSYLRGEISASSTGVEISLRPQEFSSFYLSGDMIRQLNDCQLTYHDQRPILFKGM